MSRTVQFASVLYYFNADASETQTEKTSPPFLCYVDCVVRNVVLEPEYNARGEVSGNIPVTGSNFVYINSLSGFFHLSLLLDVVRLVEQGTPGHSSVAKWHFSCRYI